MNPTLIGIIGIVVMLALFMTRMPVAYVMALVGYAGFSIMISPKGGLNLLSRNIYEAFSSYGLTTIPLFILMGQIAFNAGISRQLYDTAYKFLGSTRGGIGHGHRFSLYGFRRRMRIQSSYSCHNGHRGASGNATLQVC